MTDIAEVDDLRLVAAVVSSGSIGAAARLLQVSQPSASQRLARLERRVGVTLFDRDTQGARATPAGVELARRATHVLAHLTGAYDAARLAGERRPVRVGTIASLAEIVLPVLPELLEAADGTPSDVEEVVDHGSLLLEWVAEGTLDAVVVAVVGQLEVPSGLRVVRVCHDELVMLLPEGVAAAARGRQPLRDREVEFATYDAGHGAIHRALADLGARPHRAATVATALASGRRRGRPAVVPRTAAARPGPGERVVALPLSYRLTISLVLPRRPHPLLVGSAPAIAARLRARP